MKLLRDDGKFLLKKTLLARMMLSKVLIPAKSKMILSGSTPAFIRYFASGAVHYKTHDGYHQILKYNQFYGHYIAKLQP